MFLGFARVVDTSLAAASVADTEASAVVAQAAVALAVAALADAVASGASAVAQVAVVWGPVVAALVDAVALVVAAASAVVAGLERCSPVWGCCLFQAGLHRHHSLNRIGRRRREVLRIRYKSS